MFHRIHRLIRLTTGLAVGGAFRKDPAAANEGRITYDVRGTGEPVLFLHGIGHDRHAWDPIVDQVSSSRRMILIDLPGHGSSPLPASVP